MSAMALDSAAEAPGPSAIDDCPDSHEAEERFRVREI
eukprot:CAMPEP_0171613786 /NCGR_PEP_ID=MMETSP0990-20121206/11962_1 /TAXON_ID=483369 /ORGANISM="non described non described, Strain CCMP2098" /LENGTH=36 /DNA_ID= /DNA_START= /DNA_END= /DNA_ORIENTATION=